MVLHFLSSYSNSHFTMYTQHVPLFCFNKTLIYLARRTKIEGVQFLHKMYNNYRSNLEICYNLQENTSSPWCVAFGVNNVKWNLQMALLVENLIIRYGRGIPIVPTIVEIEAILKEAAE